MNLMTEDTQHPASQTNGHAVQSDTDTATVNLVDYYNEFHTQLALAGSIPLAENTQSAATQIERMQVMLFELADTLYAFNTAYVGEVVREFDVTPIPRLPRWVLGVINLHGDIVSVVNLMQFLDLAEGTPTPNSKLIIAQADDQRIGLLVDRVMMIYSFPVENILSPPFPIDPELIPFLHGIIERDNEFIRLLDCEKLVTSPKMQQFS